MTNNNTTLYYIHDPMCSWCWGFKPVWQELTQQLKDKVSIVYIVGGLAADSDLPMATSMQQNLAATWQRIQQQIPGTQFNFDFWDPASNTQPRRSTYPACRAVLAAKAQGPHSEQGMILGIQQAYYLQAKNPSNLDVLTSVAAGIGLNPEQFEHDVASAAIEQQLEQQLQLARSMPIQGFPSLVLAKEKQLHPIPLNYTNSQAMLDVINRHISN